MIILGKKPGEVTREGAGRAPRLAASSGVEASDPQPGSGTAWNVGASAG